jgi:uncharacterized DUF497 family protein
MKITYDPVKRAVTLAERGIDFEDAADIFRVDTLDFPDNRRDYGELRILTVGHLRGRMMIVIWTPRGTARHVISMRKANAREKARFGKRFEKD